MRRLLIYIGEAIRVAFQALKQYKLRSMLTTLGIVIGVMTVITIVALIQGLNSAFEEQIANVGATTLYIDKYPWVITTEEEWFRVQNRPNISLEEAEQVRELSRLAAAVAPTLYTRRTTKFKERTLDRVLVIGTTGDYMETANALPESGRFLTTVDIRHRRNVCVIGQDLVDELFPYSDPVGEFIYIGGNRFRVIGVMEPKGTMFGDSQDQMAIIPISTFQPTFGARWRSVAVQVKVHTAELMDDAEIELTGIMRRIRGVSPSEENDFDINQQSMLMETYRNMTSAIWAVFIGVGAISLLVGGIGIMNILLVSVTERTREIGIRKAIGAKRRDILIQFLIEAMMICALGVFIGVVLAVIIAKTIAASTPLPAAITVWVAVLGVAFVLAIGLFFGIYPARKAAQLNPIEALRYE